VVSSMMDSVTRTNYVSRADNPVADSITSELDKRRTAVSTEQDKEAIVAIDSRMKSSSASKSGYARKELSEIINLKNDAELAHFKSLVQSMPDVLGVEIIDMVNNREKELVSQAKEIDTIAAEIASRNFESQSEFQTYLDSLKLTERFSTDNLDVLQAKLAEVGAANPVEKQEVAGIDIGGWLNKGFKSVPGRVGDVNQRIDAAKSQQAQRVKASREANITGVVELLASDDKEKGATLNTIKTRLIKIQTEAEIEGFTEGQKMYAQTQRELMQGAEKSSWYNPMSWLSTGGDGAKKQDTFTGIKHQNMQAAQNASIWVDAETSLKEMKGAVQKSMMEVDTFDDFVKRRSQLGLYMKQTDIESYKHKWEEMESTKYYASQMNTASKERGKGVEARLGRNVKEQMSSTGLGSSELGKLAFGMADLTKGADGTYSRDLKTGATPDGEAAILDTVLQKTHELKATRDGMYKSEELKMMESIDLVGKLLGLDSARVAAAKERYQTEVVATRQKEFARNLTVATLDENSKKKFEMIEKYGVPEGTIRYEQNRIVEGTQALTNRKTESETTGMSEVDKNRILYTRSYGAAIAEQLVAMDKAKAAKDAMYTADMQLQTAGMPEYLAKMTENSRKMSEEDAKAISIKERLTDYTKQMAAGQREIAALSTLNTQAAARERLISEKGFTEKQADDIMGVEQTKKSLEKARTLKLEVEKYSLFSETDRTAATIRADLGEGDLVEQIVQLQRYTDAAKEADQVRTQLAKVGMTDLEEKIFTSTQKVGAEYGKQLGTMLSQSEAQRSLVEGMRSFERNIATAVTGSDKLFEASKVKGWSDEVAQAAQKIDFATKASTKFLDMGKELSGLGSERDKVRADTTREVGADNVDAVMKDKDRLTYLQGLKGAYDNIVKSGYNEYQVTLYENQQKYGKEEAKTLADLKAKSEAYKTISDSVNKYTDTLAEFKKVGGGRASELSRKGFSQEDIAQITYMESASKGLEKLKGLKESVRGLGTENLFSRKSAQVDTETGVGGMGDVSQRIEKELDATKELVSAQQELAKSRLEGSEAAMLDNMLKYGEQLGTQISQTQELAAANKRLADARKSSQDFLREEKKSAVLSTLSESDRKTYDTVSKFAVDGKVFDEVGAKQALVLAKNKEINESVAKMYGDMGNKATDFFAKVATGSVESAGGFAGLFAGIRESWKAGMQERVKADMESLFSSNTDGMSAQDIIDSSEMGMPDMNPKSDVEKVRAIYAESRDQMEQTINTAASSLNGELDKYVNALTTQVDTFNKSFTTATNEHAASLATEMNKGSQDLAASIGTNVNGLIDSVNSLQTSISQSMDATASSLQAIYTAVDSSVTSILGNIQAIGTAGTASGVPTDAAAADATQATGSPLNQSALVAAIPKDLVANRTKYIPFKGKQADYVQSQTGTYVGGYLTKQLLGNDFQRSASFSDKFHQVKNKSSDHNKGLAYDVTLANGSLANSKKQTDAIVAMYESLGMSVLVGKGKKAGRDVQVLNEYDPKQRTGHATGGHIHIGFSAEAAKKLEGLMSGTRTAVEASAVAQAASTKNVADASRLGHVSRPFESGSSGVSTISSGAGDAGGKSYGEHQLASKTGTLAAFINSKENAQFASQFKGKAVASADFDAVYKSIAQTNGAAFANAQHAFIKRTHYDRAETKASSLGFDTSNPVIKEMLFSGSVQHGKFGKVLEAWRKQVDPKADMDTLVKSFYKVRTDYVKSTGAKVGTRYEREEKAMLAMAHGKQAAMGVTSSVDVAKAAKSNEAQSKEIGSTVSKAIQDNFGKAKQTISDSNKKAIDVKAALPKQTNKGVAHVAPIKAPVIEVPNIKPLNDSIAAVAERLSSITIKPSVEMAESTSVDKFISDKALLSTEKDQVASINTQLASFNTQATQILNNGIVDALNKGTAVNKEAILSDVQTRSKQLLETIKASGVDPALYEALNAQQTAYLQEYGKMIDSSIGKVRQVEQDIAREAISKSKTDTLSSISKPIAEMGKMSSKDMFSGLGEETKSTYSSSLDIVSSLLDKSTSKTSDGISSIAREAVESGKTLDVNGIMEQFRAEQVRNMGIVSQAVTDPTILKAVEAQQAQTTDSFTSFLETINAYLAKNAETVNALAASLPNAEAQLFNQKALDGTVGSLADAMKIDINVKGGGSKAGTIGSLAEAMNFGSSAAGGGGSVSSMLKLGASIFGGGGESSGKRDKAVADKLFDQQFLERNGAGTAEGSGSVDILQLIKGGDKIGELFGMGDLGKQAGGWVDKTLGTSFMSGGGTGVSSGTITMGMDAIGSLMKGNAREALYSGAGAVADAFFPGAGTFVKAGVKFLGDNIMGSKKVVEEGVNFTTKGTDVTESGSYVKKERKKWFSTKKYMDRAAMSAEDLKALTGTTDMAEEMLTKMTSAFKGDFLKAAGDVEIKFEGTADKFKSKLNTLAAEIVAKSFLSVELTGTDAEKTFSKNIGDYITKLAGVDYDKLTNEELNKLLGAVTGLKTNFDAVGLNIAAINGDMIEQLGDLEKFNASLALFNDKFLSPYDVNKSKNQPIETDIKRLDDQIEGVLPNTREGLMDLIRGLDLTTEAGIAAYKTIIELSGSLDAVYSKRDAILDMGVKKGTDITDVSKVTSTTEQINEFRNSFGTETAARGTDVAVTEVNTALQGLGLTLPQTAEDLYSLAASLDLSDAASVKAYDTIISNTAKLKQLYETQSAVEQIGVYQGSLDKENISKLTSTSSQINAFDESFRPDTEIKDTPVKGIDDVTKALKGINKELPQSSADLWNLVKSLDMNSESGREVFDIIMKNNAGLKKHYAALGKTEEAYTDVNAVLRFGSKASGAFVKDIQKTITASKKLYNATPVKMNLPKNNAELTKYMKDYGAALGDSTEDFMTLVKNSKKALDTFAPSAGSNSEELIKFNQLFDTFKDELDINFEPPRTLAEYRDQLVGLTTNFDATAGALGLTTEQAAIYRDMLINNQDVMMGGLTTMDAFGASILGLTTTFDTADIAGKLRGAVEKAEENKRTANSGKEGEQTGSTSAGVLFAQSIADTINGRIKDGIYNAVSGMMVNAILQPMMNMMSSAGLNIMSSATTAGANLTAGGINASANIAAGGANANANLSSGGATAGANLGAGGAVGGAAIANGAATGGGVLASAGAQAGTNVQGTVSTMRANVNDAIGRIKSSLEVMKQVFQDPEIKKMMGEVNIASIEIGDMVQGTVSTLDTNSAFSQYTTPSPVQSASSSQSDSGGGGGEDNAAEEAEKIAASLRQFRLGLDGVTSALTENERKLRDLKGELTVGKTYDPTKGMQEQALTKLGGKSPTLLISEKATTGNSSGSVLKTSGMKVEAAKPLTLSDVLKNVDLRGLETSRNIDYTTPDGRTYNANNPLNNVSFAERTVESLQSYADEARGKGFVGILGAEAKLSKPKSMDTLGYDQRVGGRKYGAATALDNGFSPTESIRSEKLRGLGAAEVDNLLQQLNFSQYVNGDEIKAGVQEDITSLSSRVSDAMNGSLDDAAFDQLRVDLGKFKTNLTALTGSAKGSGITESFTLRDAAVIQNKYGRNLEKLTVDTGSMEAGGYASNMGYAGGGKNFEQVGGSDAVAAVQSAISGAFVNIAKAQGGDLNSEQKITMAVFLSKLRAALPEGGMNFQSVNQGEYKNIMGMIASLPKDILKLSNTAGVTDKSSMQSYKVQDTSALLDGSSSDIATKFQALADGDITKLATDLGWTVEEFTGKVLDYIGSLKEQEKALEEFNTSFNKYLVPAYSEFMTSNEDAAKKLVKVGSLYNTTLDVSTLAQTPGMIESVIKAMGDMSVSDWANLGEAVGMSSDEIKSSITTIIEGAVDLKEQFKTYYTDMRSIAGGTEESGFVSKLREGSQLLGGFDLMSYLKDIDIGKLATELMDPATMAETAAYFNLPVDIFMEKIPELLRAGKEYQDFMTEQTDTLDSLVNGGNGESIITDSEKALSGIKDLSNPYGDQQVYHNGLAIKAGSGQGIIDSAKQNGVGKTAEAVKYYAEAHGAFSPDELKTITTYLKEARSNEVEGNKTYYSLKAEAGIGSQSQFDKTTAVAEAASLGIGSREQIEQVMGSMDLPALVDYFGANVGRLSKEQQGAAAALIKLQTEEVKSKKEYTDKISIYTGQATESSLKLTNAGDNLVKLGVMTAPDLAAVGKMGFKEIVNLAKDANNTLTNEQREAVTAYLEVRKEELDALNEYNGKIRILLGQASENSFAMETAQKQLVELGVGSQADIAALSGISYDKLLNMAKEGGDKLNKEQREVVLTYLETRKKELDSLRNFNLNLAELSGEMTSGQVAVEQAWYSVVDSGVAADSDKTAASGMSVDQLIDLAKKNSGVWNDVQRDAALEYIKARKEETGIIEDAANTYISAYSDVMDKLKEGLSKIKDRMKILMGDSTFESTLVKEQAGLRGAYDKVTAKDFGSSALGSYNKADGKFSNSETVSKTLDDSNRYIEIEGELFDMRLLAIETERDQQKQLFDFMQEQLSGFVDILREVRDLGVDFGKSIFESVKAIKDDGVNRRKGIDVEHFKYLSTKKSGGSPEAVISLRNAITKPSEDTLLAAKAKFTKSSSAFDGQSGTFITKQIGDISKRVVLEAQRIGNEAAPLMQKVATAGYEGSIKSTDTTMSLRGEKFKGTSATVIEDATAYKEAIEGRRDALLEAEDAALEVKLAGIDVAKEAEVEKFNAEKDHFMSLKSLMDKLKDSTENLRKALDPEHAKKELAKLSPFIAGITSSSLEAGIKAGTFTKDDITKIEKYHDLTLETTNSQIDAMKQLFDVTKQMNDWLGGLVYGEFANATTHTKMSSSKAEYDKYLELSRSSDPAIATEAMKSLTSKSDQYLKELSSYYSSLYDPNATDNTKQMQLQEAEGQYKYYLSKANTSTDAGEKSAAQQGLTGASEQYLKILREFYASGDEYQTKFSEVTGSVQSVVDKNKDTLGVTKDNAPMLTADNTSAIRGLQQSALNKLVDLEAILKGVPQTAIDEKQYQGLLEKINDKYELSSYEAKVNSEAVKGAVDKSATDALIELKNVVLGGQTTEETLKDSNVKLGGIFEAVSNQLTFSETRLGQVFDDTKFASDINKLVGDSFTFLSTAQEQYTSSLESINQAMYDGLVKEFGKSVVAIESVKQAVDSTTLAVSLAANDIIAGKQRAEALKTPASVAVPPALTAGLQAPAVAKPAAAPIQPTATPKPVEQFDGSRFGVSVKKNEINGTGATLLNGQLSTKKHDNVNNGYSTELSRLASAHARARMTDLFRSQGKAVDGSDTTVNKAINDASTLAGNNVVRDTLKNLTASGVDISQGRGKAYVGDDWGKYTKLSSDLLRAKAKVEYKDNAIMQGIAGYTDSSIFDYDAKSGRALEKGTGRAVYNMVERADNTRDTLYFDQLDKLSATDREAVIKAWKTKNASESLRLHAFAKGGVVSEPTFGLIGEAGPEVVLPMDKYMEIARKPIKDIGIPMMATGGFVDRPTLAVIGEGREPEAVLPLSVLHGMLAEERVADENRQPQRVPPPPVTVTVVVAQNDDGSDEDLQEMKQQNAKLVEQNELLKSLIKTVERNNRLSEEQIAVVATTGNDTVTAINRASSANNLRSR